MHTYASLEDFSKHLQDGSSTTAGPTLLKKIEGASRAVEKYCGRSRFGSGFGPRFGTNRYSGDCEEPSRLWLDDDLLDLDAFTVSLTTGQAGTAFLDETDFILAPFDRTPRRLLIAEMPSSSMVLGHAVRGISATGMWGHTDERIPAAATMGAIADASTPTVTPSVMGEFSPGQTLWVEDEMLYVRVVGTSTLTVTRGANGSTAAAHAGAAAIAIAAYDARVVDATLQIANRRWRRRDTNQAQAYGQSGYVQIAPEPGELSILRSTVEDLRCLQFRWELAEAGIP